MSGPGPRVHRYGPHPSQYAELSLPTGPARGVVVVVHGGFWKAAYDCSLGRPLAASLVERGWAAWNVEYRRVGDGGGVPETLDDVAAAIDLLAGLRDGSGDGSGDGGAPPGLGTVVALGHSAGGHLAAWAATRGGLTAVVSQAGVLDLRAAHADRLGDGAVEAFLGRAPTDADAAVDPRQQLPLGVPLWCVHGRDDDVVPISQSRDYVAAARAAGAEAGLVEVPGDHMSLVDPSSPAWARTLELLDSLTPTRH